MKLINKLSTLALILISIHFLQVLVARKTSSGYKSHLKRIQKGKSSRYLSNSRLDFFTGLDDEKNFKGKYVYNFDDAGQFEALNPGSPIPIKSTDKHKKLAEGGFGRVHIVKAENQTEYIVKLLDLKKNEAMFGEAEKTIKKFNTIKKEQRPEYGGPSEYVMKYYAAKSFPCFEKYKCAALLLEKIEGEELYKFLTEK